MAKNKSKKSAQAAERNERFAKPYSVQELAASVPNNPLTGVKSDDTRKRFLNYDMKAVYRIRNDIKNWNDALNMARNMQPQNWMLQNLFDDIMIDALLTSQTANRENRLFSLDFNIKVNGEIDEEQTAMLKKHPMYRFLTQQKIRSIFYGYSVVELNMQKDMSGNMALKGSEIPRTNVVPQTGLFYPDYFDTINTVEYRNLPEYGTWILEYYSGDPLGLLNKAIPHVLFKRFAQSCWSELCEIYGIPPRVMKTNTADKTQLNRAEKMMKDLGSAAYFIIDNDESFEWAQGVSTSGDVYKNLIDLCRNEICLLIVGAIIGQDTKNGSRSKDEAAQEMLWLLVQSDMAMIEDMWVNVSIPALVQHGILKGENITFEYVPTEDIASLWTITQQALQYYNVDPEWIKTKFGVEITGERKQPAQASSGGTKLSALDSNAFFRKARRH